MFLSLETVKDDRGHGLLVQLERATLPEPPEGPGGRGHRHPDAGAQLAAEGDREAAAGEGERIPPPEDRRGLQLAGQHAALLLQHQHRGEAGAGGPVFQGAPALLRPGHPQVRPQLRRLASPPSEHFNLVDA